MQENHFAPGQINLVPVQIICVEKSLSTTCRLIRLFDFLFGHNAWSIEPLKLLKSSFLEDSHKTKIKKLFETSSPKKTNESMIFLTPRIRTELRISIGEK